MSDRSVVPDPDPRLAGYELEMLTGAELAARYGVPSSPLLIILAPDGTPRYSGGYTARKQGPDKGARLGPRAAGRHAAGPSKCTVQRWTEHRGAVTEVSGRGVEMGVVRSACLALGGHIEVHSNRGEGTRVEFVFPVTAMAPATIEMLDRHGIENPERAVIGSLNTPKSDVVSDDMAQMVA